MPAPSLKRTLASVQSLTESGEFYAAHQVSPAEPEPLLDTSSHLRCSLQRNTAQPLLACSKHPRQLEPSLSTQRHRMQQKFFGKDRAPSSRKASLAAAQTSGSTSSKSGAQEASSAGMMNAVSMKKI
jgi:hypothetical protein